MWESDAIRGVPITPAQRYASGHVQKLPSGQPSCGGTSDLGNFTSPTVLVSVT